MVLYVLELFNEEHDKVVIVKAVPSPGAHRFAAS